MIDTDDCDLSLTLCVAIDKIRAIIDELDDDEQYYICEHMNKILYGSD